jgi:hypothetical protein
VTGNREYSFSLFPFFCGAGIRRNDTIERFVLSKIRLTSFGFLIHNDRNEWYVNNVDIHKKIILAPIQWVPEFLSLRVKRPEHEADQSSSC